MSTPELDKLRAVSPTSQEIGEFLEWAREEHGAQLLKWVKQESEEPCPGGMFRDHKSTMEIKGKCDECNSTGTVTRTWKGYVPVYYDVNKILAEFYDIDLQKVEEERREILKSLQT